MERICSEPGHALAYRGNTFKLGASTCPLFGCREPACFLSVALGKLPHPLETNQHSLPEVRLHQLFWIT